MHHRGRLNVLAHVLDKPYSNAGGGSTAGPVFHDIMSMALERFGVVPTGTKKPKVRLNW